MPNDLVGIPVSSFHRKFDHNAYVTEAGEMQCDLTGKTNGPIS